MLLREVVGASGFEPPTSWSRTGGLVILPRVDQNDILVTVQFEFLEDANRARQCVSIRSMDTQVPLLYNDCTVEISEPQARRSS